MTGKKRRIRDKARQTETYYQAGEAVADEVAEAYLAAYRSLQAEAERVFQTFAGAFNLSQAEARRLLNDYPDADARALLRRAVEAMPEGPEKERALAEISAPAYQYRIRRIETLQDQAEARLAAVARQEAKLAKAHYTRVIEDSYLYGVYDVQRAAGVGFHFHALSDRAVSAMVNARWPKLGITYSEAVWKDTAAIAQRIRQDVVLGVMTGLPARRAIEQIEEDFRVRAYEARRLVRTETARMAAEADKAGMEACGIEEYEFCATLDEATCSRCGALDGKRFPAKQGEPGVNMEPLHPNCGCYTVPVVEEFGGRAGTRLARDPESGENVKIPGDMTFEQWKAGLQGDEEEYERYARELRELAPESLEAFKRIKYNDAEAWARLQEQYDVLSRYEMDGDVPAAQVLKLDSVAWEMKQHGFDASRYHGNNRKIVKRFSHIGNAAAMELDGRLYFAYSRAGKPGDLAYDAYTGRYPLIGLGEPKHFSVLDLGEGTNRYVDTESKFLEHVARIKGPEERFTVTILSEKHMCPSCEGVARQFRARYPHATVNVISGRRGYNGDPEGGQTWRGRKEASS